MTEKESLRGGQDLTTGAMMPNFMFVVGTSPGSGVKSDTKLIRDVLQLIKQLYNKETLTVEFPDILRKF